MGIVVLVANFASACHVTVHDLEKWRNRRGSEEKFVEWMLDPEASREVRAKAIEMLFEQYNYEGADHLPRVADLPQHARDEAIVDAFPHLRELFDGAEFSLGGEATGHLRPVQVRDGTIMLMQTTETPEVRERIIDAILVPWLQQHYHPCITSTGRHPNWRILNMVGRERGLPVVVGFIREGTMDEIVCQDSYLADVEWLPQANEQLATAYTNRWRETDVSAPEAQRNLAQAMIRVPDSRVLKNFIFEQLIDAEAPLLADVVDVFLDYVEPLTDSSDAERYAALITHFDGFLRWIGVQNVLRVGGADGIDLALNAIPDAGVWGRWGGEVLDDGLERAAEWVCAREELNALGETARDRFEAHLEHPNLVARALAIHCLGVYGDEESVALLQPLTDNESPIPAWGDEANTVGAVAEAAIERIRNPEAFQAIDGTEAADEAGPPPAASGDGG